MTHVISKSAEQKLLLLRNVGTIAHIDAGKTTTTERILFISGEIHKMGEVHEGKSKMDWMKDEKERGVTISSSVISCQYRGYYKNIIDTPGHIDFSIEVERSLRTLDGAIVLFDAVAKVETQTLGVCKQARRYNVPIIGFINKLDRIGADFKECLKDITARLHSNPVLMAYPVYEDRTFEGVICLVSMRYFSWPKDSLGKDYVEKEIPSFCMAEVQKYRENLIDTVMLLEELFPEEELKNNESDEGLSSDDKISELRIRKIIRKGALSRDIFPVFCGASLKNKGVQLLMDAVVDYLPCPLDREPEKAIRVTRNNNEILDEEGKNIIVTLYPNPDSMTCAFIFKTFFLQKVGLLTYVRVYSGTLKKGDRLFNPSLGDFERISRVIRMESNKMHDIDELLAGEVGVVMIQNSRSRTGDTLCDSNNIIRMSGMKIPAAVVEMALEVKNTGQLEKLTSALEKLTFDDPSLHFFYNTEKQLVIKGMGELHLEIIISRLADEFGVEVTSSPPHVSYKSTITAPTNLDFTYVKQTGGHGSFAKLKLTIRPNTRSGGIIFENKVQRGEVPTVFIPAVEKGIRIAAKEGIMQGRFPVEDIIITLIGGEHHEVDSSSDNFQLAAEIALREIVMKQEAKMRILEPVMQVFVSAPEEYTGTIMGELQKRRGKIKEITKDKGEIRIDALVPLSEMFGYTKDLRSSTQGYGSSSMDLSSYEIVPEAAAEKIIKM